VNLYSTITLLAIIPPNPRPSNTFLSQFSPTNISQVSICAKETQGKNKPAAWMYWPDHCMLEMTENVNYRDKFEDII
jgi:hypothetical protein